MNHQNALIEVLPRPRHAFHRQTAATTTAERTIAATTTMVTQLAATMMTAMTKRSQTKRATGCGDAEAAEQDVSTRARH